MWPPIAKKRQFYRREYGFARDIVGAIQDVEPVRAVNIVLFGDMGMKQNKSLPAEKQIVTADPDIVTLELSEDDEFLIIACDGIWDCMSSQQAVDFVKEQLKSEKKLSVVCERAFDRCLAPSSGQEGCDNMTMILVQFKKNSNTKPSPKEKLEPEPEPSVQ